MPFSIEKRNGEWCCVTTETGKSHGCHATEAEAKKQLAALYVHVPEARHSTDAFSAAPGVDFAGDPEVVIRSGKIFELGEYPDRAFSLDEEEADAAIADFSPVPVDSEHRPSLFDGKLGELRRVWRQGRDLYGEHARPAWLDGLLAGEPCPVSCTWDRQSKRLTKLALTIAPRVTDAAMMSAYAEFAGRRHSASDQGAIQQIHDLAAGQGASCASEYSQREVDTKETPMNLRDRILALFDQAEPEPPSPPATANGTAQAAAGVATPTPPGSGDGAAAAAQFARAAAEAAEARAELLGQRLSRMSADQRAKDAVRFAKDMQDQRRIFPAEGEVLAALYCQALADDEAHETSVTFSADGSKTGSRAEALKALMRSRKPHALTEELLATATEEEKRDFAVLFNVAQQKKPEEPPVSAERRAELLKMTPLGAAHLAAHPTPKGGN